MSERDCLILLGCREMQGYLYAKPMGCEQLREFADEYGSIDSTGLMAMRILEKSA
jgi:EAL domain-containing protein (putative c-di-GMP-specific phosphodiesterase class I)